ncbi:hypothetical protein [Sphingobium boeckii]|uniref:SnoaL-like domain-containing protein n=1 Tax=Sphingobium boeckii TaxID=1082345 RepID=A0A7W9AJJ0_9SPHN|nr:hypothetical protein [Sphingobium boeckii]MBB5686872.1 hypothetical protein [Sphingobium boeckii]
MKKPAILALTALALLQSAPAAAKTDVFTNMFAWWNTAFKTEGGFNAPSFRKYFTEDATLTLEGKQAISGIDNWVSHFQAIQASGAEVEIVVPFKTVFQKGDKIYSYHVIRSRRAGKASCSLAAGHAVVKGGKIASITLVRATLDASKAPLDPQCWTD